MWLPLMSGLCIAGHNKVIHCATVHVNYVDWQVADQCQQAT